MQRWRLQEDVRCLAQVPVRGGETEEQRYGRAEQLAPACERDLEGTHLSIYFSLAGQEEKSYLVCD